MADFLNFTFSGFFIFTGMVLLITIGCYFSYAIFNALLTAVISVYTRFLRFLMVSFRGWPPDHLDADGDFHKKIENNSK